MNPDDLVSVRVRLLPWRPRRRTPDTGADLGDLGGFPDDPVSVALFAVVLLVVLVPALLAVVFLGLELLALLVLLPLALSAQLLGLRPWVLLLRTRDGARSAVEVRGTRAMLARRRALRTTLAG